MEERHPIGSRWRRSRHPETWGRIESIRETSEWKELGQRAAARKIASAHTRGSSDWDVHALADIRTAWMRAKVAPRQDEPNLLRQLVTLHQRVAQLESLLGIRDELPVEDKYIAWCNGNRTLLSKYPNSFVAIDIKKGSIVVAGKSQEEFVVALKALPKEYRLSLFQTHTSLFF